MGTLLQDLRYGVRMLARNPGFTAVAVLTLAVGIGSTTAIFSIVNAVLLRPLPFKNSSRLMMLGEGIPQMGFPKMGFSAPDLRVLERAQRSSAKTAVTPAGTKPRSSKPAESTPPVLPAKRNPVSLLR